MARKSYMQDVGGFTLKSAWVNQTAIRQPDGSWICHAGTPTSQTKSVTFDFVLPADAVDIKAYIFAPYTVSGAPHSYNLSHPISITAKAGSNHIIGTFTFTGIAKDNYGINPEHCNATLTASYARICVTYDSESGSDGRTNRGGYRGTGGGGEQITEYHYNTDITTDGEAFRSIITIYEDDETDWTHNGLGILMPESCEVTEEAGGDWSLSMKHPIDDEGRWELLKVDRLIRCPVPVRQNPEAMLAWRTEHRDEHQIYQALKGVSIRTFNNRGSQIIGKVVKDEQFEVIAEDKLGGYLKIVSKDGIVGWIVRGIGTYQKFVRTDETLSKDADGEEYNSAVQRAQIRNQMFRIYSVEVDAVERTVQVEARHISYDYAANIVKQEWIVEDKLPSQVLADLPGKLKVEDDRALMADLTTHHVSGDYSYQNPVNVLLDPDNGVVSQAQLQLIRDNHNFYLLSNENPADRGYIIAYGKNLNALTWTTSTEDLVTVILPQGEQKNGKPLLLPQNGGFVESTHKNDYPFVRISKLEVKEAKVGKQYTDERTGQVIDKSLTESECYELMRKAVQKQWDAGCDLPTVEVEVDFTQLDATEEYKELQYLYQLFLYDVVHIRHEPLGYDYDAQVTQYVFDAVCGRYKSIKVGKLFKNNQSTVAGYQLGSGSVSGSKIASATISGANLQDAAITNAKIAYAAIEAANIHTINADTITSGTIETKRLKVTESLEVADGATIIGAINQSTQQHAEDTTVQQSQAIQYVANDALAITPDGLVLKSGGKLDIISGSEFTVTSPNLLIDKNGTITANKAVLNDVIVRCKHERMLTTGDIFVSTSEPVHPTDKMVWIKPIGGATNTPYKCSIPQRDNYNGVNTFTMQAQATPSPTTGEATIQLEIPFFVSSALSGNYFVRASVTDGTNTVDMGYHAIPVNKSGAMTAAYTATTSSALGTSLTVSTWISSSRTGTTAVSTTNIYNPANTDVDMTVSTSGTGSTSSGWNDCQVRYYVAKPCTGLQISSATISALNRMRVGDSVTIECAVTPADTSDKLTYELLDGNGYYTLSGNVLTKIAKGGAQICVTCGNQQEYIDIVQVDVSVWAVTDYTGGASYYYASGTNTGNDISLPAGSYRLDWQFDDTMPDDKGYASYIKIGSASAARVNKTGPGRFSRYFSLATAGTISVYWYASSSGFGDLGYPKLTASIWEADETAAASLTDDL